MGKKLQKTILFGFYPFKSGNPGDQIQIYADSPVYVSWKTNTFKTFFNLIQKGLHKPLIKAPWVLKRIESCYDASLRKQLREQLARGTLTLFDLMGDAFFGGTCKRSQTGNLVL